MRNQATVLVGNGFNNFVNQYLLSEKSKILLVKLDNYSEYGETLLSKLNNFFNGLDKSNRSISYNIVNDFSVLVAKEINSIFDETSISKDRNHFKYINAL